MEESEDIFSVEQANYTTQGNDTSELDFGEEEEHLRTVRLFLGKERQIFVLI